MRGSLVTWTILLLLAAIVPRAMADAAVTGDADGFAFALFESSLGEGGDTVLISPPGIAQVMAMLRDGAGGETARQITRALGDAATAPRPEAGDGGVVELRLANSIWLRRGMVARPAFRELVTRRYGAEIAGFTADDAAARINAWVREKTEGRIPEIVGRDVGAASVLIAVNATFFRAAWLSPFEPEATQPGPFRNLDGSTSELDFMAQSGDFLHYQGDGIQALRLPYAGGTYAFDLVLLDDAAGAPGLLEALRRLQDTGQVAHGEVRIPRFTLDFKTDLRDALQALGIEDAFDPVAADFTGITEASAGLALGQVLHKTRIEVTEHGTVAAAATAAEVVGALPPEEPRFRFVADRPFLLALRRVDDGNSLFLGWVAHLD